MRSGTGAAKYQHSVTWKRFLRAGCLTVTAGCAGKDCLICCPEHTPETEMLLLKTVQVVLEGDFYNMLLLSLELQVYF